MSLTNQIHLIHCHYNNLITQLDMTANARLQLLEELNNTKLELENIKMGIDMDQTNMRQRTDLIRVDLQLLEQNKLEYEQKLEEYKAEIEKIMVPRAINEITEREIQELHKQNAIDRENHNARLLSALSEIKKLSEEKDELERRIQSMEQKEQCEDDERRQKENNISELKRMNQELNTELKDAMKRLQLDDDERRQQEDTISELRRMNHQLSTELNDRMAQLQREGEERRQQEDIISELKRMNQKLNSELSDGMEQLQREDGEKQQLEDKMAELKRINQRLSAELNEAMEQLQVQKMTQIQTETEKEVLEELKRRMEESQRLYESQTAALNEKLASERNLYKQNLQHVQELFAEKEQDLRGQIEQLKELTVKLQKEQELALSLAQQQQSRIEHSHSHDYTKQDLNNSNLSNASNEFYDQLKHEMSTLSQQRQESLLINRLKNQAKEQKSQIEFLITQNEHMKKELKRQEVMLQNADLLQKVNQNVEWIVGQMKAKQLEEQQQSSQIMLQHRATHMVEMEGRSVQTEVEETPHPSDETIPSTSETKKNKTYGNRLILSFLDASSSTTTTTTHGDLSNRVIEISEEQNVNDRIDMLLSWVASTKNILKHTHTLMDDLSQQSSSTHDSLDENKRRKLKKLLSKFSPSKSRQAQIRQLSEYNGM